jgi:glutathione synthase/RimK-type ligase-like ATP-grasp enzyme
MRLLGVYRERRFSPGKVREDAAILEATLDKLSHLGHDVHLVAPEDIDRTLVDGACVLTMAQSARALETLEGPESRGARVINSVASVRNCYRKPLIRLLIEAGLPMPRSRIMATDDLYGGIYPEIPFPCWIKRGDVHAMEADDVRMVASREELVGAVRSFRDRHIESLLVQEHMEGEVIKFYGVGSSGYFSAFLSSTGEEITLRSDELRRIGRRAAMSAGLDIYGGDAIVTPEHALYLIDLNDWPSFSRCCEYAAAGIARYVAGILEGD